MSKVAFLGLGAMGARMASRLLAAGHDVTVWNRTIALADPLASEGAKVGQTPAEAVKDAELVISMVRDDEASRSVWLDQETGAVHALRENAIAIEMSTVTPGWVKELASAVNVVGAGLIDAPVAGSRPQAEAGKLIIMAGGDSAELKLAEPVLNVMGEPVHHAGPVGSGAILKLVVNALFGIQVSAMAELMTYMKAQGLDLPKALEILGTMPVTSPGAMGAAGLMAGSNFTPMFPIDLVEKDFGYVVETGEEKGANMAVSSAVREVFAKAKNEGYGGDNISGVIQHYQK